MEERRVLSLDELAAITARLQAGAPKSRVLAEAQLTDEQWLEAQRTWLERMASLAVKGRPALHERFLGRLDSHEEEEPEDTGAVDGDWPRDPEPVVVPASSVGAPRCAEPEPAVAFAPAALPGSAHVSSPPSERMAPPPPRAQGEPAAAQRSGTMGMTAMPDLRAVPFESAPAPSRRSAGADDALPFEAPPTRTPTGDDALPFQRAASGPRAGMGGGGSAAPDGALPFRSGGSSAPPAGSPDGALPFRNEGSSPPPAGDGALPFRSEPAPGPETASASADRRAPEAAGGATAPPETPRAQGRPGTMAMPAFPAEGGALPFTPGQPPPRGRKDEQRGGLPFADPDDDATTLPQLTVEQYAWLCEALRAAPDHREQTLAWLRLTPAALERIERQFEERFRSDHAAREQYREACHRYRRR